MHDIKQIRENPQAFDAAMQRRGLGAQSAAILELDAQYRALVTQQGELQQQRNVLAKDIGRKKKAGDNADALMEESRAINEQIKALDDTIADQHKMQTLLASLPNILADDVPDGGSEADNSERHRYGQPPAFDFTPKPHYELGEALEMMDFEIAAQLSGSRFVILRHYLAKMERALASLMLDIHSQEFGYVETLPPFMVRDNAMYGTGQLPKFAQDSFCTTDGYWLIPTAEVPLTNQVADKVLTEDMLPLRYCAYTPCFRSEAGSAGKDTRGLIRQHQFSKVELVSITTPDASLEEHERLLSAAERILQVLELHYRVMTLCSGDTGFGAQKTYDIEVWLPGQDAFREISSCSNMGAFQARRMQARYRPKESKKPEAVHTLNGSGLAIGRTIVAILEQYQQADGSIIVPAALIPYMGGVSVIEPAQKAL